MRANNLTLLTDLYELTMMQGYFKNPTDQTVVFDMFYRDNPCGGGFAICAGLEQVIEYIENLRFTDADIEYLRGLSIFEEDFLEYLRSFHFTGDIYAIPEGTVIFPREPMVKVVAPIMEAQLVETAILNIMNHQSLIATKAARVCYAAKGDGIMEFGLRRAQGPDAGIFGARAAVIGGCVGTSCVLTGQMFDVPVLGTHAHSWIMSFPDEYTAFKTYARMYPDACILLVDTYDVLKSGVPNAIRVFEEMREEGIQLKKYGIRIDSYVYEGYEIPIYYDPMIGKLIVWATNREYAIERMRRVLHEYKLTGVKNNISYLRAIMDTPDFVEGHYDTGFITKNSEYLQQRIMRTSEHSENIALIAAYMDYLMNLEENNSGMATDNRPISKWKEFGLHKGVLRI